MIKITKENRTKYIGARFTESEKTDIEKIVDLTDTRLSDFLREAIFSHINFIKQNKGNLEKIEIIVVREVD